MKVGANVSSHRVRRLAFAVQGVDNAGAALVWRRALHDGLDGGWRAALDVALDGAAERASLGSRTWRLPRLHLRVRAREPQALAEALRDALDEALAGQVSPAAMAPVLQSAAERAAMSFETYLSTGRVPWHDDEADAAVVARTLRDAAIEALDAALTKAAWPAVWVQHASEAASSPLLQRWAALLDEPAVERLRAALVAAGGAAPRAAAPLPRPCEAAEWLWRWWRRDGPSMRVAAADPAAATPDVADVSPDASAPAVDERPAARGDVPAAPRDREASTHSDFTADDDAAARQRWWAHDAGIVLLHPYLPTLLRATGCAVDDALRPGQFARAAALLCALTTGRDDAFEFELTLAKLLLGLAPDAPLPPGPLAIDAAARAEADALLEAAIGHWPALGGTGVEAFRASFLARDGTLARDDDGWHLRVVEEPFDVLLGRLPWGIGLVRLPWMDAPLHVHWGRWGQ